jgi:hypothetical protein
MLAQFRELSKLTLQDVPKKLNGPELGLIKDQQCVRML